MSKYISIEYCDPCLKSVIEDLEDKLYLRDYDDLERREIKQKIQEYAKDPYSFQRRTALVDIENKDFNFLDEVNFLYGFSFPQIKVFNQKNRKSLTLTFKDNEQYQKAKEQIIQAIT